MSKFIQSRDVVLCDDHIDETLDDCLHCRIAELEAFTMAEGELLAVSADESATKRIEELELAHDKAVADGIEIVKGRDKRIAELQAAIKLHVASQNILEAKLKRVEDELKKDTWSLNNVYTRAIREAIK